MGKELALSLVIGATMGAGFKAATGQSVKQIGKIGEAAAATKKALSRIEKFRELKRGLGEAKRSFEQAERQAENLGREFHQTQKPTRDLTRRFEEAKRAAASARKAYHSQAEQLQQLRRDADAAGQSFRGLSQQQKQLRTVGMALGSAQRDLAAIGTQHDALMQRRANLRGQLTDVVALGLALGAPVKAAIDFESAMAEVRKTMDFDTPEQFIQLGRQIRELSTRMPMAADQIADIVAAAGRAGIPQEELTRFTEDAIKMGIAFDVAGNQAGGAMIGLRTIFKLTQDRVVGLGDAINYISNSTDSNAGDILEILNRTGGIASQFGLSAEQLSALASTFRALKIPTQVAATGINALLNKLNNADKQNAKFASGLREIGFGAREMKEMIEEDAQGALLAFLEAVEKADNMSGVLFDMFGQEYVDDISNLVGGLDQYRKSLALLTHQQKIAGAMTREYNERVNTTESDVQLATNEIAALAGSLGDRLLPAVTAVAGGVGAVARRLRLVSDAMPGITTAVIGLGAGLIALKIGSIAVGYAWTFMVGGALVAKKALVLLRVATLLTNGAMLKMALGAIPAVVAGMKAMTLALMANPIGLVIGGIALGAAAIIANWSTVKTWFSDFWSWMTGGTGSAWDALKTVMSFSPLGLIMRSWGPVVEFLSGVMDTIGRAVSAATSFFGGETTTATAQPGATRRGRGRAAGAAVAASLAVAPAAASTSPSTTVNDSSTTTITIVQQPGEDAEALADKVDKVMRRRRRGALHD